MEIIAQVSDVYATDRTIDELSVLGLKVSPKLKRKNKRSGKVDAVIGGFFFLDVGLLFQDNLICTCRDCRAPLQIRPHNGDKPIKLCVFCAADEALKSYWATQKSASADSR